MYLDQRKKLNEVKSDDEINNNKLHIKTKDVPGNMSEPQVCRVINSDPEHKNPSSPAQKWIDNAKRILK